MPPIDSSVRDDAAAAGSQRRRAWKRLGDDRGQSMVEFALAAVLFLTTIFGTIEFGLAIWHYNMLSNLAQEGARRASVCGTQTGLSTTECDIQSYVSSRALGMDVTVTTTPANVSTVSPGQVVTVLVRNDFTMLTPLLPAWTLPLRSTAQMVVSR